MACTRITVLKTLTLEQSRKMSTALTAAAAAAAAEVENLFLGLSWVQEPALTCSARCWEDGLRCKSSRDWRHFEDCSSSAGSEWKGASSSLSPSTAQSLWRSVHSLRLRWPVLRNPDHTPAVITEVIRAVINPTPPPPPSPSRKNQSKNWVLVENEINHLHKPVDASPDLSWEPPVLWKKINRGNEQIVWYNFQKNHNCRFQTTFTTGISSSLKTRTHYSLTPKYSTYGTDVFFFLKILK